MESDVVFITETWLFENVDDREIALPGFHLFRKDTAGRQGGGMLTFVRHGLIVSDNTDKLASEMETLWSVFTKEAELTTATFRAQEIPSIDSVELTEVSVLQEHIELQDTKWPGPDGISAKVLKELAVELAEPMYLFFRASLNTGQLPPYLEDSVDLTHTQTWESGVRKQP
ncbi:unnamed protein product [Dibothriocephalus latus]|uniref:Uncharacterized protein n=1 Tax=Dibothriocephalus latus TaxID=60516 RepID=A0A3P6PRT8_DIBLA|nr:unnamed protein product [Dibothriocephalus latus]